jgi:hypothetical protein
MQKNFEKGEVDKYDYTGGEDIAMRCVSSIHELPSVRAAIQLEHPELEN